MGEGWKHKRAASFTQQQCFAYERELKTSNLFSRTTKALERTFSCTAGAPVSGLVSQRVFLKPRADGGIVVIHGNAEIGAVVGEDAAEIAQAIESEPHCPGMALAVIDEASSIAGEFLVRIIDHTEEE